MEAYYKPLALKDGAKFKGFCLAFKVPDTKFFIVEKNRLETI